MPAPKPGHPALLTDLVRHSTELGSDLRLIQGAGGNFSVKADGVLWIKASGTRLVEAADRPIYVPLDEAATREAVLLTEDLASCVLSGPGTAGLRPSIETALHALLPHRAVFHVHGIGSIAAGLTGAADDLAGRLPAEWDVVVVPYAKPGVELARAVLASVPDDLAGTRPLVLVLINHGLVVGADHPDEAAHVLAQVESVTRRDDVAPPVLLGNRTDGLLHPAGTVDEAAADVLCAGALTPDSAVFLGPAPFGRSTTTGPPDPGGPHSAVVGPDGSVWVRPELGPDEREVTASLVDVARQTRRGGISTLSADQVAELVNWEAEKWRRQLKR